MLLFISIVLLAVVSIGNIMLAVRMKSILREHQRHLHALDETVTAQERHLKAHDAALALTWRPW